METLKSINATELKGYTVFNYFLHARMQTQLGEAVGASKWFLGWRFSLYCNCWIGVVILSKNVILLKSEFQFWALIIPEMYIYNKKISSWSSRLYAFRISNYGVYKRVICNMFWTEKQSFMRNGICWHKQFLLKNRGFEFNDIHYWSVTIDSF